MDFITSLPLSEGHDSILVIVDRLTKMAHFVATDSTINSPLLLKTILGNVFKLHGFTDEIISDRGSVFVSKFMASIQESFKIKRCLSSSYHPESDGQTERLNSTLEQYLRVFINKEQNNWSGLLPMAEIAYNYSAQPSTKFLPFNANYGFHPKFLLCDSLLSVPAAINVLDNLKGVKESLLINLKKAKSDAKIYADKNVALLALTCCCPARIFK